MKTAGYTRKLLVIGHDWPQPEATAAGQRMWQLLNGFCNEGYHMTFASTAGREDQSAPLESLGIETLGIRLNHDSFDQFVRESQFDLVLFDRFMTEEQFSWRIREQLPQCKLILDTEDLHSLRMSRESAVSENRPWRVSDWMTSSLFYRELASMIRCDLSLIISETELELLQSRLPFLRGKLLFLPFQFTLYKASEPPAFSDRNGFVFVGNGKHRPNTDAIFRLKSTIWPLLRSRLPEDSLLIYGAYLSQDIYNLNAPDEGFEVRGWAPKLETVFLESRLQLAPLAFGAGVKGKILNGLRFGLPTLSTSIGWEGIYKGSHLVDFLSESPEEFAGKAAHLYTNEKAWTNALHSQLQASAVHFRPTLEGLLEVIENLEERRESLPEPSRVLQNMLRHQAFDRVRYLSRWIEAKDSRSV